MHALLPSSRVRTRPRPHPCQVIEAEGFENAALDEEARRLEEELAASTTELEAMQRASSSTDTLDDLSSMRCAWRKRCRAGYSQVLSLACSLAVLEVEAELPDEEQRKRPSPSVRHDVAPGAGLAGGSGRHDVALGAGLAAYAY